MLRQVTGTGRDEGAEFANHQPILRDSNPDVLRRPSAVRTFHAVYNEHKAVIDIQRLEVIEGRLPRRALSLVLDWAELHQGELLADWELCQARELPLKIAPLE